MQHVSFPDIGQFRNLIRNVKARAQYVGKDVNGDAIYDPLKPLPTLKLEGTVKLHGTNAAIARAMQPGDGESGPCNCYWFQSREHIIGINNDNAGFVRHFSEPNGSLRLEVSQLLNAVPGNHVVVYGEWCGKGVQKGVAISEVPKMFVIFAIRTDGTWLPKDEVKKYTDKDIGIYNIYDYVHFQIDIDFANPELSQNKLQELTLKIEQECPVGAAFGAKGVGEGIVWKVITPGWEESQFWMKVKGEKHSVSKVKTLASVDVEKIAGQKEFVASVVTEARCCQSITKLLEAGKSTGRESLGEYLRWIYNDIVKEETDTAVANGIELDKIGGLISNAAKQWYFANEATL